MGGSLETLGRYSGPIDIIDLQSRGGLPTVFWTAEHPSDPERIVRMSDPTTKEMPGGMLVARGGVLAFLAGRNSLVYWTELRDGKIETAIHQPDGRISWVVIEPEGARVGDFRLVEDRRGQVTFFYVEKSRQKSEIKALSIPAYPGMAERRDFLPNEAKTVARSSDKYLQIIDAVDSADGPTAVVYALAPRSSRMMKLRGTPGANEPAEAELRVAFAPERSSK